MALKTNRLFGRNHKGSRKKYIKAKSEKPKSSRNEIKQYQMKKMNDFEKSILNTSAAQITQSITVSHHTLNSNLVGSRAAVMVDSEATDGAPDTTSLNDILNNAVQLPATTSIASVPNEPNVNMYQMLSQVQTLDSYISLLTAYSVYNEHPEPYDITKPKEASAFTQAMAKWRNFVITGGAVKAMAGYLPVGSITTQSYTKRVLSADLHPEFLGVLFGAFGFPEAAMGELEGILQGVVSKLENLKLSFSEETETLDHFLTYYYFSTVHGTGGDTGIPAMYVPKVRTFYLNIDQSSYKAAVGKSSANYLNFSMTYYDMDTTMSPQLVANDSVAIDTTIQTLTGQTAADVKKLMNMKAVHTDPTPVLA